MRPKKHQAHENHERWLVSYADFITLLFAFFVVMFAVSQVDSQKLGRFVESVNIAFAFQGPFPESSSHPIAAGPGGGPVNLSPAIVPPRVESLGEEATVQPSRRERVERELREALKGSPLEGRVRIRSDVRGVVVSLSEAGFFDVGSAVMRPDSLDTLRTIAGLLAAEGSPIAVEGHTDDTPIRNRAFASNWELAATRATTIVRWLIEDQKLDPRRLSATGFAEFRPTGDNRTPEGRAQNRRVDLVILTEGSNGPAPRA